MSLPRLVTIGLLLLGALQGFAAFVLADWAFPLFGDPPILGAGISMAAAQLHRLAEQDPEGFKYIQDIDSTLRWLFGRHREGLLYALGATAALAFSSIASFLLAFTWGRMHRQSNGAGT